MKKILLRIKKVDKKFFIILILIFASISRLYRLDYPKNYVFDEVYHAFTAREYLKGSKEAWEWWTTPPPGVAYEWTHPPLAKEIMTGSMFLLRSQDAWVFRLPGAMLGVLTVYLVYLLGSKLLKNELAGSIAAFTFSIEGLNFVQSRTGMNDIYFVTFMLISLLYFLNKRLFISAVFLGLALSSKWASVYMYLLYIPLLLVEGKLMKILYFVFIPALIYLLTYIPFFILGHTIDQFIQLQQQMWWYHTGLKATHGYSSAWWSWPLNLYPVWYFVDYQKNTIANIFASGNLVVFLVGSISIGLTIWEVIKKRTTSLLIIILGFLIFWLPWAISPRIMFLYHFAPSIPFLCLCLGHQLISNLNSKKGKKLVLLLLILMGLNFIFLYPFLTGIHIPKNLVELFFLTNFSKNPF